MKRRSRRTRDGVDDYSEYYDEEVQLDGRRTKREREPSTKLQLPPWLVHLMILACVGLLLLGLLWATAGGPVLEKTLQALVAPLGLVWLGLFTVTYFCLLNKLGFPAFVSFACWIVLTVSGNAIFSGLMVSSLQGEFEAFNFGELKHLDVAVILGGGMMTTPSGDAQVTDAGDRAIMALRLLREGKADRIICTGTSGLPLADGELTQADSLEKLLLSLGVTQDKIVKIGGRNTIQEMQALDKWLSQKQRSQNASRHRDFCLAPATCDTPG